MRFSERCSVTGVPVGRFKLEAKLWLIGLRRYGGNIGLTEIYPELRVPVMATRLRVIFQGGLGSFICMADCSMDAPKYAEMR